MAVLVHDPVVGGRCPIVQSGPCEYWSGTAPFCKGSCPGSCRTLSRSKSGNGAYRWNGTKTPCQCCQGPRACTPTQTTTKCYGVVKNEEVTVSFQGPFVKTCSTYACGVCFGFSYQSNGTSDYRNGDNGTFVHDNVTFLQNLRKVNFYTSSVPLSHYAHVHDHLLCAPLFLPLPFVVI
jgi:hypothetical protein